jgi:Transposase DNA-binding
MEAMVIEHEDWIETEFGAADLGDARRTQRLLTLMGQVAARPGASLPEACGSRGQLKAAYRFFANEAIEPEELWASHIAATYERAAAVPVVLAVQDTTELDWGPESATARLGPLGAPSHQGLLVHTTVAFTPERVPLGIVAQAVWARDPWTVGQRVTRKQRPIAEKESYKWLASLQAVAEARQACPQTHWVSMGDREADVYDLFIAERPVGVDLLIRAAWDRRVEHPEQYLWATVTAWPVAATLTVHVPRHEGQPARQAVVSVRFGPVTLRPPRHRQAEHLPAVTVWAVSVLEEYPPAGVEPLEWLLLTTWAVPTVEAAVERVEWYGVRFGIEVWHKVLKSGCRIEARQLETGERLQRCLPLYSVLAWRIL